MADDAQPGLYDPGQERDSCGFGLIANLDNQPSRWVVDTALASLARMSHRGAIGADGKTGDGCGVLLHRPEAFLRHVAAEAGLRVGHSFTAGNVFLPRTLPLREPVTLTRAIAMAGGLKQDTKKDTMPVLRQEPGATTRKEITVDLTAIEKKRSEDLALLPNDIVDVPTSAGKSFLRSLVQGVVPGVGQLPVRVVP